jgi:hypothetical protein
MKKLVRNFALLAAVAVTATMTSCQKELDEVAPAKKEQIKDSANREQAHPPIVSIIK